MLHTFNALHFSARCSDMHTTYETTTGKDQSLIAIILKVTYLTVGFFLIVSLEGSVGQSYTPIVDPKIMLQSITPLTPDVATLGQYALQPPNLSNGLPQQNIPLVEIKENGLTYPISLFYNYSGFKVKEEASSYGLGWGMTEDVIIRIVNHVPDENDGLQKRFEDFEGIFEEESGLGDPPPANSGTYTHPDLLQQEFNFTRNRLFYKLYDAQPDVYIYNCGGYSGKFFWINDKAVNLEYNDVLIYGERIGVKQRFTIWTPEGIKYTFDKADRTWTENPEIVRPPLCSNADILETYIGHQYATTWRVSEIRNNATKSAISFKYKSQVTTDVKDIEQITSVVFYAPENQLGNYFTTDFNKQETYIKTMHEVFFLDEINSEHFEIDFITKARSDGGEFRIDSIKVFNKRNLQTPVKTVAFDHGYFGNTANANTCWLKLMGVTIAGMGLDSKFQFSYINESFSSTLLDKTKVSIDHWGYFNGKSNSTLVPLTAGIQSYIENNSNLPLGIISWANRNPDTLYNKIFTLETVQIPTKGFVRHVYESSGGKGIRVKQLQENDGQSTTNRYYDYGQTSAVQPVYSWSEYVTHDICKKFGEGGIDALTTTFSAYLDGPPDVLGDDSNFFENVTEYFGTPDGAGGIRKHKFQKLYGYGNKVLQKERTDFEYGNQSFLRRDEYFYSLPVANQINYWKVPELMSTARLGTYCETWLANGYTCSPVDPLSNYPYILGELDGGVQHAFQVWIRLDSTRQTMDTVVMTNRFYYKAIDPLTSLPLHTRVVRQEQTLSNGQDKVVEVFYPGDDDPDNTLNRLGLARMFDMSVDSIYLVSPVVKSKTIVGNSVVSKEVVTYSYDAVNQLILNTGYELHPSGAVNERQSWQFEYDAHANVVNMKKENDIPISICYGYDNALSVIKAENVNATELNAAVSASTNDFDQLLEDIGDMTEQTQKNLWSAFNDALRNSLPLPCTFITYTHVPLIGVTSQTDSSGIATYFEYDEFGRMKCIKDNDGNVVRTYSYHYKD